MRLDLAALKSGALEGRGLMLPMFDLDKMRARTKASPRWLHFGAGNILRAYLAVMAQTLLEKGLMDTGLVVVETYDEDIVGKAFAPFDNLALSLCLRSDGTVQKRVVASIAQALEYSQNMGEVERIFCAPTLQMASLTITEKGYQVVDAGGAPLPVYENDFVSMDAPRSAPAILLKLLYARYKAGGAPIALCSMDNCSHNGEVLKRAVLKVLSALQKRGVVDEGFRAYVEDEARVAFPCTMIDKITPRPDEALIAALARDGFEGMDLVVTDKHAYVSGMVNAEECEYLVIEDAFPNGKPPLDKAGALFATRQTVDRVERMKVCTCLNPLHTALAIFGCLLGYTRICDEMGDAALRALVKKIGYDEGLPVVVNPKVISAGAFLDEVVNKRLVNPFMPDTPQRIACDTSRKIPVRFGETLKAYQMMGKQDLSFLEALPLVFAGYARYLCGIDDNGECFALSPDPGLEALRPLFADYALGAPFDKARLIELFSNAEIFGVDLYAVHLGDKAEKLFFEMSAGKGAVRQTLKRVLDASINP